MRTVIGLGLGLITAIVPGLVDASNIAQAQTPASTASPGLIVPRREVIYYPSASDSLTVPDPQSSATVTLTLNRVEEGIALKLAATSLQPDRCALVSIQLPPNMVIENTSYQLATTPVVLIPLTSRAGYCGAVSTYRQTYVSQPKLDHQTLYRLNTPNFSEADLQKLDEGKVKIPFTMEVFFLPLREQ